MLASLNAKGYDAGDTASLNPGELRGVIGQKKDICVTFPPCPRSGRFNTPANAGERDF